MSAGNNDIIVSFQNDTAFGLEWLNTQISKCKIIHNILFHAYNLIAKLQLCIPAIMTIHCYL